MITPNDYISAVAALLEAQFPGERVYLDVVPENFARPSNEVETAKVTMQTAGCTTVSIVTDLLIRTFVLVDAYHNSSYEALYSRVMQIMGLFACGYMTVQDPGSGERRAPKVTACTCPVTGKDYAEIRVTFEMQVAREDFAPQPVKPVMENFRLRAEITN